ncbi:MAG: PAS domain-containing protein [Promethearchaeota archaeon]
MNFKPSKDIYKLIIENANDIIAVLDKKFNIEYVNQSSLRVLKYEVNDVIGKIPADFVHPDDLQIAIKGLGRGFNEGEAMEEVRIRHKNGNYFWFEIKGRIFTDEAGNEKALLILRDTTEKKNAEQKLRESEERYRLITENAHDMIAIINPELNILYRNHIFNEILGFSLDELNKMDAIDLIHPEDFKNTIKEIKNIFKSGKGKIEARILKKDGNYIWGEIRGKSYLDEKGNIKGIIIVRDVNDRKISELRLQSQLKNLKEIYKQNSR